MLCYSVQMSSETRHGIATIATDMRGTVFLNEVSEFHTHTKCQSVRKGLLKLWLRWHSLFNNIVLGVLLQHTTHE